MRRRNSSRCSRKLHPGAGLNVFGSAPTAWPSMAGGGSVRSCEPCSWSAQNAATTRAARGRSTPGRTRWRRGGVEGGSAWLGWHQGRGVRRHGRRRSAPGRRSPLGTPFEFHRSLCRLAQGPIGGRCSPGSLGSRAASLLSARRPESPRRACFSTHSTHA